MPYQQVRLLPILLMETISQNHIMAAVCSCEYCQMIDVIFGDPLLNAWEKRFIGSVASQGWHRDYSDKQKACIEKIYRAQRQKYVNQYGTS